MQNYLMPFCHNIADDKQGFPKSVLFDYFFVTFLAILVFGACYGYRIVLPTYTDWLMTGGDLTQHYLGWKAFRIDDWHFPIGIIFNLSYPSGRSIIFTDSIPCLAVFFKIFRFAIPHEFQYFGLWGLMSFILMGIFSYRIIRRFTDNRLHIVLCSIIFMFAPTVIQRMFLHTALAGQWIIMYAIDICLAYNSDNNLKKMILNVSLLSFLSSSIHIYYIVHTGIILCGECLYKFLCTKKIRDSIFYLSVFCGVGLGTLFALGGFYGVSAFAVGGLGLFSFNLNGLYNPQDFSSVFKNLPLYRPEQYEGMAYIGAGMICMFIVVTTISIAELKLKERLFANWREIVSIVFVIIIAYIVSASNIMTLNDKVIAQINLPDCIYKVWSIFRATGRFSWLISYTVMLLTLGYCCRLHKKALTTGLIITCLIIQGYDLSGVIMEKRSFFSNKIKYISSIDSKIDIIQYFNQKQDVEHVVLIETGLELSKLYDISAWALDNKKTMNTFWFARPNNQKISSNLQEMLNAPNTSQLFICLKNHAMKASNYKNLHWYDAGEYILGYVDVLKGFKEAILYSPYSLGTEIVASNTDKNSTLKFVKYGLSHAEKEFTWTDGSEMAIGLLLDSRSTRIHGQIDIAGVYTGKQRVIIYANNVIVFDSQVDSNQKRIDFYFDNPGYKQPVDLILKFPERNSPFNRGESQDKRLLSLAVKSIKFQ